MKDGETFTMGKASATDSYQMWSFTDKSEPIGIWGVQEPRKLLKMGLVLYDTECDPFVAVPLPPAPVNTTANITVEVAEEPADKSIKIDWNIALPLIVLVCVLVILALVVWIIGQACCGWSCKPRR